MSQGASFLPVLVILSFAVLLLLAGLAFFGVKVLRSGGSSSNFGGCALAALLGCLGLCALAVFAAAVFVWGGVRVVDRAIEHNPLQRIELRRADSPSPGEGRGFDASRPLHLIFSVHGSQEYELPVLERLVREISQGDPSVTVRTTRSEPSGESLVEIDVALPAEGNDLDEIEAELRRRWPEIDWGQGVAIEFQGAARDT